MDPQKSQNLVANDNAAASLFRRYYFHSACQTNASHDPRSRMRFFSSARLTWLIVLLVFPLLIGAKAPTTNEPVVYREGFLQVVSPDKVTVEQAKGAAKKVKDAWKFDLDVMHWTHPAEMERPLTLRLISDDRMNHEHPGGRAFAEWNGNRFNVKMSLTDARSIDLTFAHELGHIQSFRALGKYSGKLVPTYFLEGHGLMMNLLYADHLRMDRHDGGRSQGRTIMSITPEEAGAILTDERYFKVGAAEDKIKKENRMECMGLFFVEYLRVRKGMPDAVPRMGRVFELMGQGKTYEQAFGQTYGFSINQVIAEVVAFFGRTEGNRAERFKGTGFEKYLSDEGAGKSEKGGGAKHQ